MPALDFTALTQTLTDLTSADDAIVALINKFAADVTAAAGDQAKVVEIAAGYKAQADRLAAASVINTTPPEAPPAGPPSEPPVPDGGRRR